MADSEFPFLDPSWQPTLATLHAYAHGVGVIPRAHAQFHDKWWHISLKVRPDGLTTDRMALPGGEMMNLRMDLMSHMVVLETSGGVVEEFSLTGGATSTAFGNQLVRAVAALGLEGDYERSKFEDDSPREYDPVAAEGYFDAFLKVSEVFEQHRNEIGGDTGPVQLWPHGFDLAFEWFGTRTEKYGDEELPSQLNLGFYPAGDAYFYSNPWPFEESLTSQPLPAGAVWHTEGWQGTMLPYTELAGDADGPERLSHFARAVFEVASPTLLV